MKDPRLLQGIGVSPGTAIGPAYIVPWGLPDVPHRVVSKKDVPGEIERLQAAIAAIKERLEELRDHAAERAGHSESKIFDAQILMLEDTEFIGGVQRLIKENQLSAERAFEFKVLELRALWAQSESQMLRQRRADLSGIGIRVLQRLMGQSIEDVLGPRGGAPAILFTRELTPGLTVEFSREHVAGFASAEGTSTSHAAILAHSLGIPCVMGLVQGLESVRPHGMVILDGTVGTILTDPTPEEIAEAELEAERRRQLDRELASVAAQPAVTVDGVKVSLRSNVDLPEEVGPALENGAEGVGLLRTEFLVVGRTELPSEDEQAEYFSDIARRFEGAPVVIRTYDLGGDKFPAAFRPPREANPFLGWRAIRVCLDEPEIFRTQARAILRARLHGNVQLMLPLITQVEELERARELVAESAEALQREGIEAAPDVPIGVMVETPAAAMLADELAQGSDFLSVGSNDLTQYTLAVDRGNARLADRFTPLHPAVVRLLKRIVDAGGRAGLDVSMCGEMAADPRAALLLVGLGYRALSVSPLRLPLARWLVRQFDHTVAESIAAEVLEMATTREVVDRLTAGVAGLVDVDLLPAGLVARG
ncbi:MAG: phosphoenolpyruvate--protein phosphotransferase [Gemmatimonadetes bacterium]|nr:phosphoenolpyruvate--protein phosphotransferase [Gemmatimonadota bacterium]